jgi:hypothetical protein
MIRTSNVTMEADRLTYILHPQNFNRDWGFTLSHCW